MHQPSPRSQLIRRVAIYSVMSVSVIILVALLVFIMLGYRFDRHDGTIEQGGLVQFNSRPTGATVTLDGASFGSLTPSKTTMASGEHFVTMGRQGYKTWQKSVKVVAGSVLWLNYARLIPTDLKPERIVHFPAVSGTLDSPNDKWMAIKENPASPTIRLADLSGDTVKIKELTLPAGSYTAPSEGQAHSFSFEKWDPSSRYILMKHTYDTSKQEWIVVDTENIAATKNITTLLNIDASHVVFNPANNTTLYAQTAGDIRKIDLGAATISRPLVTNVAEFSIFEQGVLAYTSLPHAETNARTVGYYQEGEDEPQTIRSYTDDGQQSLHIAIDTYFGEPYVAISYGQDVEVFKGDLPKHNDPSIPPLKKITSFTFPEGVGYLSIMNDGRFVTTQNGPTYKIYDIELNKTTATTLQGTSPVSQKLAWLDSYTLISDRDDRLRLYEFDGSNQHTIMPVTSGFTPTLNPNQKYLYGIVKSAENAWHLERVRLIL